MKTRTFTQEEAKAIGQSVGIDFHTIDLEQFRMGLSIELEHGLADPDTNVTGDNLGMTAKIAWAHLKEIPNYYTRLEVMEEEGQS